MWWYERVRKEVSRKKKIASYLPLYKTERMSIS